jgi:hypothetical protein
MFATFWHANAVVLPDADLMMMNLGTESQKVKWVEK